MKKESPKEGSKEKESISQSTKKDRSLDEQHEILAGQYVHKFNELCRQNKLNKPNYKWKFEKVQNKKKIKYYINQDQLGISVKIIDKSKAYAKLQSVKLAYEEAIRILPFKQQSGEVNSSSYSPTQSRYHEQLKDIKTFSKMDKKEIMPSLARAEQDIDVFLESESKMYVPEKCVNKNESVESNPIEYSMIKKGQTYYDYQTPVIRVPSPLPSFPLPKKATDKQQQEQSILPDKYIVTEEVSPKKDLDNPLDRGSTLRIASGLACEPSIKITKKELAEEFYTKESSFQKLNNIYTIRTKPKNHLTIHADLDIEMLQYLISEKKKLAEAAEQVKNETPNSNTNFLRLLNILLLQNEKISIEIKISSDFGKLSNKPIKHTPEKMNEKLLDKVPIKTNSESSIRSLKKWDTKKLKPDLKIVSQIDDAVVQKFDSNDPNELNIVSKELLKDTPLTKEQQAPITWISRLNCFYLNCCFTTIIGTGKTTNKSINDAAMKMITYLYSLVRS